MHGIIRCNSVELDHDNISKDLQRVVINSRINYHPGKQITQQWGVGVATRNVFRVAAPAPPDSSKHLKRSQFVSLKRELCFLVVCFFIVSCSKYYHDYDYDVLLCSYRGRLVVYIR